MMTTREDQTVVDKQNSGGSSYIPFTTGVVVISGLVYLYFTRKPDKKVVVEEDPPTPKPFGKKKYS